MHVHGTVLTELYHPLYRDTVKFILDRFGRFEGRFPVPMNGYCFMWTPTSQHLENGLKTWTQLQSSSSRSWWW